MKIKTSELKDLALDYVVAMIEGATNGDDLDIGFILEGGYSPSTVWAQGGPIVEREGIAIFIEYPKDWGATDGNYRKAGDTPLIAAMRCYVASKLGDEVEIPKELT
jgi:hypothetical protein